MPGGNFAQSPEEGGVCITETLITKRNLAFPEDEDLSEKMFHTLAELQTVRLDREGITAISNLEGLQNLHSLYLQANKIQRIENLACVPSLRFLSLAGNQIRQVENLHDLPHLQFLDLSENLIETLKLDEFPQSLLILNLSGNSCTNQDGYRELVTEALPLLLDLDKQPVLERWASDEEDKDSSDEDEEFPELSGPFCTERGGRAFQGFAPSLELTSALWGTGEAKIAAGAREEAPGPDQHLGQSMVQPGPGISLACRRLTLPIRADRGLVWAGCQPENSRLSPGAVLPGHLPPPILAPRRLPRGAEAGDEQTQGTQAAGSPDGAPPEDGDKARPHRPPPAARGGEWGGGPG